MHPGCPALPGRSDKEFGLFVEVKSDDNTDEGKRVCRPSSNSAPDPPLVRTWRNASVFDSSAPAGTAGIREIRALLRSAATTEAEVNAATARLHQSGDA